MPQPIFLNGINGSTGQALDDFQLTTEQLAKVARQQRLSAEELREAKLRKAQDQRSKHHFGVSDGVNIAELAQAGWGLIFPASLPENQVAALKDALKPLLDLRREQAGRYYFEFSGPESGYWAGESKNDFLKRFGRGPGAANPESGVPFYLLIVGSPEEIPFSFQYQLDLQYGVGRIYFDDLEAYAIYAQGVVAAETGQTTRSKSAVFFGPSHDQPTGFSSSCLVSPLAEKMTAKHTDWNIRLVEPAQSTKSTLSELLGGAETPALLFTASHGLGFSLNDSRLLPQTGALLCQDFSGYSGGRISEQYYFSADDIPSDADVAGTLAFFFACFGGGCPRTDNFYRAAFDEEKVIAPYAFLARLPLRLLSHPRGGALGVYAHVDRAWGYSFLWDDTAAVADVETFQSMLSALLSGKPAGAASDYFGMRYGEIAAALTDELDSTTSEHQDELKLAWWWAANHDARNYTFIGDPAVRLATTRLISSEKETLSSHPANPMRPTTSGLSGSFSIQDLEETSSKDETREIAKPGGGENPDVQFTAFYSKELNPAFWYNLPVYVHLPGMLEAVTEDSLGFVAQSASSGKSSSAVLQTIQRGTEIVAVPELPGCSFNPPKNSLLWLEDWHRMEFRVRAQADTSFQKDGIPTLGRIAFYVGPLLVAETRIWAQISNQFNAPQSRNTPERESGNAYKAIFVSYSHQDVSVVEKLENAYKALGMQYLRDVENLRSGEQWNSALLKMIETADIFQLYWSAKARQSKYVEQEWRFALGLQRENFIRPVYWEKPMPPVPAELGAIHFAPIDLT